jgi:hypothetical protein
MQRKDWTLLAICAAGGAGLTPVQLQKSLFILGEEMGKMIGTSFYDFRPYHYGPFDGDVYSDAEKLEREGLIAISKVPGRNWNQYVPTPDGCAHAEQIDNRNPLATTYLRNVVKWAQSLSFSQLVRAIYDRYPHMRVNSVFQG